MNYRTNQTNLGLQLLLMLGALISAVSYAVVILLVITAAIGVIVLGLGLIAAVIAYLLDGVSLDALTLTNFVFT